MITEWQPVMPDDKVKFKSRTLYELLRDDHTTFLIVGRGVEHEAHIFAAYPEVVAWREYDCRPTVSLDKVRLSDGGSDANRKAKTA